MKNVYGTIWQGLTKITRLNVTICNVTEKNKGGAAHKSIVNTNDLFLIYRVQQRAQ